MELVLVPAPPELRTEGARGEVPLLCTTPPTGELLVRLVLTIGRGEVFV